MIRNSIALVLTAVLMLWGNSALFAHQGIQRASAAFELDGGSNLDSTKDGNMPAGRIEFLGAERVKAQWIVWANGKPSGISPTFHLPRKKA